ncbi:hypothetical protein [Shimia sagamensis]|uniref:DUF4435 domain-containing protein n=1 Tax=Shimia sagamensis TaxID=1566352 RepID=A0ABY1PKX1_9RHOB|nr:hypothetical protein [Shimia sagamensis]SMP36511.1 hypothetical protein SAMN06265373_1177 [Shimia sagamensis]
MSIPKRKVEEIRLRYELEPELNDVYVEGSFDKEVVDGVLSFYPEKFRPCYSIDDVEVSGGLLKKHGLTSGNRQRVIALAYELSLPIDTDVRLLIDRDFDDWLRATDPANGLVKTKFCDTETTFFSEDFVKKILLGAAKCKIPDWAGFFSDVKLCLFDLYCLRLEVVSGGFNTALIDIRRCLTLAGGSPNLNINDLIERSLSGCATKHERQELFEKVKDRAKTLRREPHQSVTRGHDFIRVLGWCVRQMKGVKSFQDEEALERLLVLLVGEKKDDLMEPIS